jgi:formyl-CoA transferase
MSGIYEMKREPGRPPVPVPLGGVGDIGSSLFAVIGVLAALAQRERTGRGQHVDISMFDAMVAITDIVTNFWSMGLRKGELGPLIMHGFRAKDGWFILQVGRPQQFARLVELVGHPEWATDTRFATRQGWLDHLDDVLRPAIEGWAAGMTKVEACHAMSAAGLAAGPCLADEEVAADPHLAARGMLVEIPRTDGVAQPVLTPGNPVRMSAMPPAPAGRRVPWLGEHTTEILSAELGMTGEQVEALREAGVIG